MSTSISKSVEDASTTLSNIKQLQQKLDQQLAEDMNEKEHWKKRCKQLELELSQYQQGEIAFVRQKISTMSSEVLFCLGCEFNHIRIPINIDFQKVFVFFF